MLSPKDAANEGDTGRSNIIPKVSSVPEVVSSSVPALQLTPENLHIPAISVNSTNPETVTVTLQAAPDARTTGTGLASLDALSKIPEGFGYDNASPTQSIRLNRGSGGSVNVHYKTGTPSGVDLLDHGVGNSEPKSVHRSAGPTTIPPVGPKIPAGTTISHSHNPPRNPARPPGSPTSPNMPSGYLPLQKTLSHNSIATTGSNNPTYFDHRQFQNGSQRKARRPSGLKFQQGEYSPPYVSPLQQRTKSVSGKRRVRSQSMAFQAEAPVPQGYTPGIRSQMASTYMAPETLPLTALNLRNYGTQPQLTRHQSMADPALNFGVSDYNYFNRPYQDEEFDPLDDFSPDSVEDEFTSQPSSRRMSQDSSIDDVFAPLEDYNGSDIAARKEWPDLSVLEDFCLEEMEELKEKILNERGNIRLVLPNDSGLELGDEYPDNEERVNFNYPLVSNVDTPLLNPKRVNEIETGLGRLRPVRAVPWAAAKKVSGKAPKPVRPPLLTGPSNYEKDEFRFTYFREDLEATVHLATLSGLSLGTITSGRQPLREQFAELFHYKVYTQKPTPVKRDSTSTPLTKRDASAKRDSTPFRGEQMDSPRELKISSSPPPEGNHLPHAIPRNTPLESPAPSVIEDYLKDPIPFWLDVMDPTDDEMKAISKAFGIHPLTNEDIILGELREKVELFKDYYFICFRSWDIFHEKRKTRAKELKRKQRLESIQSSEASGIAIKFRRIFGLQRKTSVYSDPALVSQDSTNHRLKKRDELVPMNVYMVVFRDAILTFHYSATPHTANVRKRIRLLKDYMQPSSDWISFSMCDDIVDQFAPMVENIEDEVNYIEDYILKMHDMADNSDDDSSSDDDDEKPELRRRGSVADKKSIRSHYSKVSGTSSSSNSSSWSRSAKWEEQSMMLRRIGVCRNRVSSVLRLLGSKADVVKGIAKRLNEHWDSGPRSDIGMYLGDIQDHIVTMVQSLNHYENLLSRAHSNFLAQCNINEAKVSNNMNDTLGRISIAATVVVPLNIVTGLWGMNVEVPGQFYEGVWCFNLIVCGMVIFSYLSWRYMKRVTGL
ncbi:hypothetical protein BABINDRAFT_159934 [Babjeviella inositovora NRRL Y-12698]|uniref:Uncharacterized protein n=1 Tax=Babjeviella inositovora NRRL Y-12698 TaxID=984486 RepID=A0A1E3QVI3_9ASCO|nr:uncharacterized protein BABINDRAFT_159934 [Babjeviella inositovora NRRL Y-12698]ODQ81676.1 hypothetical protein BABINDRAFT_159934 [Babjeviella inositovora NRRL Y-12698]